MRTVKYVIASTVALGVLAFVGSSGADDKKNDKPEYTIKQVMQQAHKEPAKDEDSLRDKVVKGKASPEEKKQLLKYYVAMSQSKPPQGDEKVWKEKTTAIVAAAEKDDLVALKKATACADCHGDYKPKKK